MRAESTIYDGKSWRRYPESKNRSDREYFKRGNTWLHRYVWEKSNGEIPEGYHIHHKNGNCQDNRIENLEMVSPTEHSAKHPFEGERLEKQQKHADKIRPLTKAWHASEEGRDWHRNHAIESAKKMELQEFDCKNCGKTYKSKPTGTVHKYCSNACKSECRRK
ncbi:MAG: HNH endonuclease [Methanosarcinales archaeon]|nr:HNH endonuclease [Methanosarcinales archaeon]